MGPFDFQKKNISREHCPHQRHYPTEVGNNFLRFYPRWPEKDLERLYVWYLSVEIDKFYAHKIKKQNWKQSFVQWKGVREDWDYRHFKVTINSTELRQRPACKQNQSFISKKIQIVKNSEFHQHRTIVGAVIMPK